MAKQAIFTACYHVQSGNQQKVHTHKYYQTLGKPAAKVFL